MRLMLDTNAFIYYAAEHDMLCDNVKELLLDYGNTPVICSCAASGIFPYLPLRNR